jgi:iron complex outermembrane receptor protein
VKIYASYSTGFHSGGYNIRANCVAIPSSCRPINDEKVQSFELGSKMTFFDDALMMNTALFHNIYSDIQLSVFTSYTLPNGSQGFFGDFTNAGKGHIDGLEEEFAWKPADGWTLSGNFAYLKTKYAEYLSGVNIADKRSSPTRRSGPAACRWRTPDRWAMAAASPRASTTPTRAWCIRKPRCRR